MINLSRQHDKEAGAASIANAIAKEWNKPSLLLFSGGSALKVLDYLPKPEHSQLVTIGCIDERLTSTQKNQNAHALVSHPWTTSFLAQGGQSIIAPPEQEPTDYAAGYELALRKHISHPDTHVMCVLGMGIDAHTAGIMPAFSKDLTKFSEPFAENYFDIFDSSPLVSAYEAGQANKHSQRATVTFTFLRHHVHQAWLYVFDSSKHPALLQALQDPAPLDRAPVAIIHDMQNVTVVSDAPMGEPVDHEQ